ncbi:MAG: hypothetical protein LPK00_05855 [Bacillaceae bacterium]|nr:hypothetical protein [Bacillaceae bacterium]
MNNNKQDIAKKYISTAFYQPNLLPGYSSFKNLLTSYEEIKEFFETLGYKDSQREEFNTYKNYKESIYKEAIASTNLGYSDSETEKIAGDIFKKLYKSNLDFPTYLFMADKLNFIDRKINFTNKHLLDDLLMDNGGAVIVAHHWGYFQYAMIPLMYNYPVTFIMADYFVPWAKSMASTYLDQRFINNIDYLGIQTSSNNSKYKNETTLYHAINQLKKNRVVFIMSDHSVAPVKPEQTTHFLGNEIFLPLSHVALGISSKKPLIHMISSQEVDGTISITFDHVIQTQSLSKVDMIDVGKLSMSIMEKLLIDNISDWNFADYYYLYMRNKRSVLNNG